MDGRWKDTTEKLIGEWSIISLLGTVPDLSSFSWLKEEDGERALRNIAFARDMITSDIPKGIKVNERDRLASKEREDQSKAAREHRNAAAKGNEKGSEKGLSPLSASGSKSHKKKASAPPSGVETLESVTGSVVAEDGEWEAHDYLLEQNMLKGIPVDGKHKGRIPKLEAAADGLGKGASSSPPMLLSGRSKKAKVGISNFTSTGKGQFGASGATETMNSVAASSKLDHKSGRLRRGRQEGSWLAEKSLRGRQTKRI